jgi:hypothetical protein
MFTFEHTPRTPSPSNRTRTKGKFRALHLRRHHSQSDTTPGFAHRSYPFTDSEQSLDAGPSFTGDNLRHDFVSGAHVITRSASSPLLSTDMPTAHQAFSGTNPSRFDPRYNEADDGSFPIVIKQLSPIAEQDYFSPEKQTLPLPAEDVTPSQTSTPTESQYSGAFRAYRPLHALSA